MNDADKKKLYSALGILTNLDAHLSNLNNRGARAVKYWATESAKASDPKTKKGLKDAAAGMTQLLKDAKVVTKDLNTCAKEAGDAKLLAAHATAKEFRDKVVAKRLASAKAFEQNAAKFTNNVLQILGGSGLYPGMKELDIKVSMDSLKNFSHYYNEMRLGLAKV